LNSPTGVGLMAAAAFTLPIGAITACCTFPREALQRIAFTAKAARSHQAERTPGLPMPIR
jgi:hypothetical protein